jgi:hypothetical protein
MFTIMWGGRSCPPSGDKSSLELDNWRSALPPVMPKLLESVDCAARPPSLRRIRSNHRDITRVSGTNWLLSKSSLSDKLKEKLGLVGRKPIDPLAFELVGRKLIDRLAYAVVSGRTPGCRRGRHHDNSGHPGDTNRHDSTDRRACRSRLFPHGYFDLQTLSSESGS